MSKLNTVKLETTGYFASVLKKLDALNIDVKSVAEEALEKVARKVMADTEAGMDYANLPARGDYSKGTTKESIIRETRVRWEGMTGWVPVGFDFSKPGAGGYLITGTPKMPPDKVLHKMFKEKSYMKKIQKDMSDIALEHIFSRLEG